MASIPHISTLVADAPASAAPQSAQGLSISSSGRFALVDAGRGIAACWIVAHHLTVYGSVPDLAVEAAPGTVSFLYDYARMAVYVFLVFGGFSLGWTTDCSTMTWRRAATTFGWRYLRLAVPYLAMISALLLTAWLTRNQTIDPPLIDSFSWGQLLAHVFFLQDVLGYGNLSAGTWYLCVDIQFALLFLVLSALTRSISSRFLAPQSMPAAMSVILIPLGLWSAWHLNRLPSGDAFVPYYLAAMVLGVLVAWWKRSRIPTVVLVAYVVLVAASLVSDFRPRLAVALGTTAVLAVAVGSPVMERLLRPLAPLGQISYSLFLIHYLVNWLVLTALLPVVDGEPNRALLAMAAAFVTSLGVAVLFYRGVERPFQQWAKAIQSTRRATAS